MLPQRLAVRAAVLDEPGQPLVIRTVYLDAPLPNEVLVRTTAVGLCHSDLHYMRGSLPISTPAVLGHEVAGVVERVGRDVTRFHVGDQVVATVTPSCGACASCVSGHPTRCERVAEIRKRTRPKIVDECGRILSTLGGMGAFADALVLPEASLAKVGDEIPARVACLLGCCVSTGFGAVMHATGIRPADTVAIIGCGGVGMAVVQAARLAGARRIIAIDIHAEKLKRALTFGATHILTSNANTLEALLAICPGGVTHSFEAVGHPKTAELAISALAPGGTATLLGLMPAGSRIEIDPKALIEGDRKIQGAYMGANKFLADVVTFTDDYANGRIDLDQMVTSEVTLDTINEGFEKMRDPSAIRTVITFEKTPARKESL
jgi:S-(hydroxymethyl)glutathione dehydrogenase/alcohol dehydrogenase